MSIKRFSCVLHVLFKPIISTASVFVEGLLFYAYFCRNLGNIFETTISIGCCTCRKKTPHDNCKNAERIGKLLQSFRSERFVHELIFFFNRFTAILITKGFADPLTSSFDFRKHSRTTPIEIVRGPQFRKRHSGQILGFCKNKT